MTGSEPLGLTVVLTEGFGRIPMAERTFALLHELEGMNASVSGATQIRAGVVRPEVIIPLKSAPAPDVQQMTPAEADGLHVGDHVRVIRRPRFGLIGEVAELMPGLVQIETEARVRALRVRAPGGQTITVPRANVEIIQQ